MSLFRFPKVGSVEAQLAFLLTGCVEVRWIKPALVLGLEPGPVAIEHREPGGVTVLALLDHVLAEDTFEGEAEALGRGFARQVLVVALPLEATVAEIIEDMAGVQEQCFGREPAPGHV